MSAAALQEVLADFEQSDPTAPLDVPSAKQRLEAALEAALQGRSRAEAAAVLEAPGVHRGVLQWILLTHLLGREKPRTGLRLRGARAEEAPEAQLPSGLLQSGAHAAVELLLSAGGCSEEAWPEVLQVLCRLLGPPAEWPQEDCLWLRLAAATALCVAEGEFCEEYSAAPPDFEARCRSLFAAASESGVLFEEFGQLTTWHLRYIVGSWHSDEDWDWARAHVEPKYKSPDCIGQSACMVKYRDRNDTGVSVHEGIKFYDDKIPTLPVIHEYGGVCGAVCKFGAAMCHAHGVPAMPVGQPGHCAMVWRAAGGQWKLQNSNSDWKETTMHTFIQRTWLEELGREKSQQVWLVIPTMEKVQTCIPRYLASERFRLAARLTGEDETRLHLLTLAVSTCPWSVPAWNTLFLCLPRCSSLPASVRHGILRERVDAACQRAQVEGPRNLSRLRPVTSSSQERAENVVDGSGSEWFPASEATQWLEIDLEASVQVEQVRIQWWGDYGTKSSVQVLSKTSQDTDPVPRAEHAKDGGFNGWTEFAGWPEATRILRLEVGDPAPDCFGLGKQYGIRQVEVLGHRMPPGPEGEVEDEAALLLFWAEAELCGSDLGDQHALDYVRTQLRCGTSSADASCAIA